MEALEPLKHPLIQIGEFSLSLFAILYTGVFFTVLYLAASRLRRYLITRFASRERVSSSVESTISLFYYLLLALGGTIILQSAGVEMSSFAVLAGAVGIGIGFGLQNIANNFISGIIILFERPIKIGDRVEVKDIAGQVTRIGMRASTVLTNDKIAIIVPNSDFISQNVTNWSHSDDTVRLRLPVTVSYDSDPHKVTEVIQSVFANLHGIASTHKSDVILDGFSENGMTFVLRVWTKDFLRRPGLIRHQINLALWDALQKNDIRFAMPRLQLQAEPRGDHRPRV